MRCRTALAAVAAIGVLTANVASACSLGRCFGAIAIGPNGTVASATHHRTAPEAYAAAEARCGAGCGRVEVFFDGCAALATDDRGTPAFGFAAARKAAVAEALELCSADGTRCGVRLWACSR